MSTKKKLFLSAAGAAAGGGATDVDDVFNTFVDIESGTGVFTVNNGINLSGEGGIVWAKSRNGASNHYIFDPNVGSGGYLIPNSNTVGLTGANYSFTSTGFTDTFNNYSGNEAVWWTFRKAPKFFDKVTYTGNGTAGRTVAHNLESVPGMIIVKCTSHASTLWAVYHRGMDPLAPEDYFLRLNDNGSRGDYTYWNDTAPTSTEFTLNGHDDVNQSSRTYVAYLFAHNNNDGEFGPNSDQDIIKCGTYTADNSATASINLGFEPQWIIYRPYDDTTDFKIIDNIRGFMGDQPSSGFYNKAVSSNQNFAEYDEDGIHITPTGFEHVSGFNNKNFVYTAIRRGPLATPTSATDVFAIDDRSGGPPNAVSGFPVDMGLHTNKASSDNKYVNARLIQGKRLFANLTSAEGSSSEAAFDYMTGFIDRSDTSTDNIHYMWKRAPSYFDVVTYGGNSTAGRTINHNLGVVPEMIWVKNRTGTGEFAVYHSGLNGGVNPEQYGLYFTNAAEFAADFLWDDTAPTNTQFSVGNSSRVNSSASSYIAFLFATVAGISKVGSYTGNGSADHQIDCGFSSGARFVLIKKRSAVGNWVVMDSERGIVAGNDPYFSLNTNDAETTDDDIIEPYSGGFALSSNNFLNASGNIYIFYAIA